MAHEVYSSFVVCFSVPDPENIPTRTYVLPRIVQGGGNGDRAKIENHPKTREIELTFVQKDPNWLDDFPWLVALTQIRCLWHSLLSAAWVNIIK